MLDYNRTASMYTTQYGFLAEAEQFQKWHRRTSQYKVTKIDVTPGTDLTSEPWKTAAVTRLVFGSERPKYSFYNMGWDADLATEIRVLLDDENLYVAFDAAEPVLDAALKKGDRVGVKLYLGVKCVTSVFCNPEGKVFSDAPNAKVKIVESKRRWQAFLTIPKASCKIPLKGNVRALFFRTRQARGDSPENKYIWSPRLGHWSDHPAHRLGVLIF
jgi:hypothetical protein